MPEFMLQTNPEVSPKSCYCCHSHEGPFVNLQTFDPTGRIILLCAPQAAGRRETGCAGAITQAIGGLTPAGRRSLERRTVAAEEAQRTLESHLDSIRAGVAGALS